jgi:hypothetical protein
MNITRRQLRKLILEKIRDISYYDKDIETFDPSSRSKKELVDLYGQQSGRLAIGATQERFHKAFQLLDLPVDIIFLPRRILMSDLIYPLFLGRGQQPLSNNTTSMTWTKFASALASLATKAKMGEIMKIANSIKQDSLTIVFQTLEGHKPDDSFGTISIPWILHDLGHGVFDEVILPGSIFGDTGFTGRVAMGIPEKLGGRKELSQYVMRKYPNLKEFFKANNFTAAVREHDTHASMFAWYLMYGEIPPEIDEEDKAKFITIFDNTIDALKGRVYITDIRMYNKR